MKLINYSTASKALTDDRTAIRSNYSGKKYIEPICELKSFESYWLSKYNKFCKNFSAVGENIENLPQANIKSEDKCTLHIVSQQRDLLKAFLKWKLEHPYSDFSTHDYDIDTFLKAFNCG